MFYIILFFLKKLKNFCKNRGEGIEKDWDEAFKWYEKAASHDIPLAVRQLARMYFSGEGCETNLEKALELYNKAADLGDAGAMLSLGK